MDNKEYEHMAEVGFEEAIDNNSDEDDIVGDSPCPCCGYITIPNKGDALAYICPVCLWEIDLFIQNDYEESDLNHGLTLLEARKKYQHYGAVLPHLKAYCRQPKEYEYPRK